MLTLAITTALGGLGSQCTNGPCAPFNDHCGVPFANAPQYHLMDQHGCGENDPNGPVFDPVHGVVHHFYQIHLATGKGHGPDYGHFVSKDFVNWAQMPVAIWNGVEVTSKGYRSTPYDNEAIFTGSATVVKGAGPNGAPGVVNVYPGLCNKQDWPSCETGTLLALAVPDDYSDVLLTNWSKPKANPIIENTQRDPSGAWKEPSGEWRLRTFDSKIYGSASDADFLAGKWYTIGVSKDLRSCECPSFYPLPASSPGFEAEYDAADLPTHVHKTSCGGDWWQLGTHIAGAPKELGTFAATPGWEDVFAQRKIDVGNFYASKDNEYPTKTGGTRRINWGWATVPPASTQTLPREITFNAAARQLQQYPIEEQAQVRGQQAHTGSVAVSGNVQLAIPAGVARTSETVVTFTVPKVAATFGVSIGKPSGPTPPPPTGTNVSTYMEKTDMPGNDYLVTHHPAAFAAQGCEAACAGDSKCKAWTWVIRGDPAGSGDCCRKGIVGCPSPNVASCTSGAKTSTILPGCGGGGGGGGGSSVACTAAYPGPSSKPYVTVPVECAGKSDVVNLLSTETSFEVRIFTDVTFVEAFFAGGRAAMVVVGSFDNSSSVALTSTAPVDATQADVYAMNGIWTSPDAVRKAPRVYN